MPTCQTCGAEFRDEFAFCPSCGAAVAAPPTSHEQRKTVTVLFCDLAGSTAMGESLDAERLRALLARYFERMGSIVERHGGSVEKFIGDAVMAVFGVPTVHEDDALRALRAAIEMRDALPKLGLEGRIGVMTGTVVTGTEERLATGDAVNIAARLEQAAQPGEVLVGEPTVALARAAADVEPVEPLTLKGKAEPVAAYRLLAVHEAAERQHTTRFVGRETEVALIRSAFERVVSTQHCELVTILGDPGVGKSRLVAEALASVDATVVRGRCLPYGEGITYWPVVEVLKQLDMLPPDPAAAAAIRSLLGEDDAATSGEEIAWAFRKTLERAAAERPVIVVFEDIQWGEPTFHDLIEHVALLSTGAAILVLCLARPDMVERRPTWPAAIRLDPLTDDEVAPLLPDALPAELRQRISRTAGGNPLFIEEMLAMAQESDGEVVVPPSLHALLAARLDQLDEGDRSVLERGAIEGEVFHRGAVQALAARDAQVTPHLATLVRQALIRPHRPVLAGEDGFQFRHLLIRDAAYEALPKAVRADLHERFASWLETHGAELVELDEILGYHLEQACIYRTDLGQPPDPPVAFAARQRLKRAASRSGLRADYRAAVSLFQRAAALVPPTELDYELEVGFAGALFWGGTPREALARAESLSRRAAAVGDHVAELAGRIQAGKFRTYLEPEGETERLTALVDEALPVFQAAGDHGALSLAYGALGHAANIRARLDEGVEAYDLADSHLLQAGLPEQYLGWRSSMRLFGSTSIPDLLAWMAEHEPQDGRNHWLRQHRAVALAALGQFEEARAILAENRRQLTERGGGFQLESLISFQAEVELLAGDAAAAAALGAEACRMLDDLGERSSLSTEAGQYAQALYALDRLEDADAWAFRAQELGASDDALTQTLWRQVRAKLLARHGAHAEAERLAREAVAIADETDMIDAQGDVYADLGEVLAIGGRSQDAVAAFRQALDRFERKGNVVSAHRTESRIANLVLVPAAHGSGPAPAADDAADASGN